MIIRAFISSLIGYIFGCLLAAYFIGKYFGKVDIRKIGTNNAGASNVTSVMGWKLGIITAAFDILKGTIAVLIVNKLFPGSFTMLFLAGAFVILGHVFPFFLGFKGGKGTASIIGVAIAINIKIAIIMALTLVIITVITDYIAIGSILMNFALLASAHFFNYGFPCILISFLLLSLCIYKHQINIKRIFTHNEIGLREMLKKN